jgi:hypothetical protein
MSSGIELNSLHLSHIGMNDRAGVKKSKRGIYKASPDLFTKKRLYHDTEVSNPIPRPILVISARFKNASRARPRV